MRRVSMLLLCLLVVGCDKKESDPGKQPGEQSAGAAATGATGAPATGGDRQPVAPGAAAGTTAPGPGAGPGTQVEASPALPEAEIADLMERWLRAQNEGDFDAYEKLYATRFTGIKRVGSRTSRFDRKGWIKDRRGMFRRKMEVRAADTRIAAGPQTAVVTFTQTWSSGSFQDEGPKQLVVVREGREGREGKALRIAREEMLRSTLGVPEGEAPELAPGSFFFVITGEDGTPYVVLSEEAEDEWAPRGEISMRNPGNWPVLVTRPADPAALPPALAAWQGKPMVLHEAAGETCHGTVDELLVMSGFWPHFGMRQEWEEASAAQMAADAWSAETSRFLVGRVKGACQKRESSWWAHAPDAAPRVALPVEDEALAAAALARFRKLASYRAIQKQFMEETGQRTPWETYLDDKPLVTMFREPASGRRFVAVTASAGVGCGDFYGELWALFEARDGTSLVLLTDEHEPGVVVTPMGMFDADGDGKLEVVGQEVGWGHHGPDTLMRQVGTVYRETGYISLAYMDCPC